jgi:hypothetical protein
VIVSRFGQVEETELRHAGPSALLRLDEGDFEPELGDVGTRLGITTADVEATLKGCLESGLVTSPNPKTLQLMLIGLGDRRGDEDQAVPVRVPSGGVAPGNFLAGDPPA